MTTDERPVDPDQPVSEPEDQAELQAETQSADPPEESARKKRHLSVWQESLLLLAVAIVLAVAIKALFVQAFYIPSESMEPGLVKNDRILVQKMSYWFGGSPKRGDVVVFQDPGGWLDAAESAGPANPVARAMARVGLYPQGGHLVKRVVGVEGDVIECCDKQGRISVNGTPLNEDAYVNNPDSVSCRGPMPGDCDWTAGPVPDGHIFVMGDNRNRSADSTVHLCQDDETDCSDNPFIPVDLVVGKVFVLLWPADHFSWVKRPATFADVAGAP